MQHGTDARHAAASARASGDIGKPPKDRHASSRRSATMADRQTGFCSFLGAGVSTSSGFGIRTLSPSPVRSGG